jgi:endonuclease III
MIGGFSGSRDFAYQKAFPRQANFFMLAGRAVIEMKGEINGKDIQPKKSKDRPCADLQKHQPDKQPARQQNAHEYFEPLAPKGAIRCQNGVKIRLWFIKGTGAVHGYKYRQMMIEKKTQTKKKPATKSAYSRQEVAAIFERFREVEPEPKGELDHVNAFTLLVAVVLSAQATDIGVNKATKALFAIADTPEKMLELGEAKVGDYIKTIGLWRNKAKNVIALSEALICDYEAQVPDSRDELIKLPGVGRKTANVVLSMAFGQATMAVDTHIFRLANRLRLAPGKTPDQVEQALLKVIPQDYLFHAHHWLILHGRYVCKARKPECERCVIADLCKSDENSSLTP